MPVAQRRAIRTYFVRESIRILACTADSALNHSRMWTTGVSRIGLPKRKINRALSLKNRGSIFKKKDALALSVRAVERSSPCIYNRLAE